MKTLIFGFGLIGAILGFSLRYSNFSLYLNLHSFGIVFIGTIGVFFISNPPKVIRNLFLALKHLVFPKKEKMDIMNAVQKVATEKERGQFSNSTGHPLLDFGVRLWKGGVDQDVFEELLYEEHQTLVRESYAPVFSLKSLSKYPPALGMIGTVFGMIALFKGLDDANRSAMGGNLAVAMTATLYGLSLANFILLPLADRLKSISMEEERNLDFCFSALSKINRGEPVSGKPRREFYEQAS